MSLPAVGAVLAGKYKIVRVLGQGGMGMVYEAWHTRLHQRIAIKMLRPELCDDTDLVARFEREARAAAKLESPRVVKVLDVDSTPEGLPYMVMEFLEGHDLDTELQERQRFPITEAVGIIMEACVPIAEAHAKGIVHRDLKPSNLFLHEKDGERRLKLLDFGISKVTSEVDTRATSSFQSLGTPVYMSPEQVRRSKDIDGRTDIWSLGIILYEMVTGTVPYAEQSASAIIAAIAADPVTPPGMHVPDLPVELELVILRALQKDPKKRFKDVRELALALAPFGPEEELVAFSAIEAASGRRSIPDLGEARETLPPPSKNTPPRRTPPTLPLRTSPVPPRVTPTHTQRMVTPAGSTPPPGPTSAPPSGPTSAPPDVRHASAPPDSGHVSGSWTGRPPPPPSRWKPFVIAISLIATGVVITLIVTQVRKLTEPPPAAVSTPTSSPSATPTASVVAVALSSAPSATVAPQTSSSATVAPAASSPATAAASSTATVPLVGTPRSTHGDRVKPPPSATASASAEPINPLTL